MRKILFLLCPTDCLESILNEVYESENYFYTSLGNSFNSDTKTLQHIRELIVKHWIQEINFVLSSDNQIVLDALGGQVFSEIRGLKKFYKEIGTQKRASKILRKTKGNAFSVLSYYLNKKIKELEFELCSLSTLPIVKGKIYSRGNNRLINIYPDVLCLQRHCLN